LIDVLETVDEETPKLTSSSTRSPNPNAHSYKLIGDDLYQINLR
jgi:hypothetical protein